MIEKENDEEWFLVLQSEQEAQEVDENECFTNMMTYLMIMHKMRMMILKKMIST